MLVHMLTCTSRIISPVSTIAYITLTYIKQIKSECIKCMDFNLYTVKVALQRGAHISFSQYCAPFFYLLLNTRNTTTKYLQQVKTFSQNIENVGLLKYRKMKKDIGKFQV